MAVEDPSSYTEVDPGTTLSQDATTSIWTNVDTRNSTTYLWKDHGVDKFKDFQIDFTFKCTSNTSAARPVVIAGGNLLGDNSDYTLNEPGFALVIYQSNGNFNCMLQNTLDNNVDNVALTENTDYFCVLKRKGTTLTLWIYSDSGHTTLVDTLVVTCDSTRYRYLFLFQSYNSSTLGKTATGYIKDITVKHLLVGKPEGALFGRPGVRVNSLMAA